MDKIPEGILRSKNEKILALMGKEHLNAIAAKTDNNKTAVILTDKRIYQIGTVYTLNGRFMSGEIDSKVVELKDVSNISIIKNPSIYYNIVGFIFIVLASFFRFIPGIDVLVKAVLSTFSAFIGLVFVLLYIVKFRKEEFVKIAYSGTAILSKRLKYTDDEVTYFMSSWREAKEALEQPQSSSIDNNGDIYDQLEKLNGLKEKGIITEEEFAKKKSEMLGL